MLGPLLLLALLVSVVVIVLLIAKLKLHPFLSILIGCYAFAITANGIGLMVGAPNPVIANPTKVLVNGFGSILGYIGLVIVFGAIIGQALQQSGAAVAIAEKILAIVGDKRPALAMSIIGWVVSIPVFCDSGFVVLSSLSKSLARVTKGGAAVLGVSLATGLYATHTFVPPTPGPIAAAGNVGIGNDALIWVILFGAPVAMVAAAVGYLWAQYRAKNMEVAQADEEPQNTDTQKPAAGVAALPILLPLLLMAFASVVNFPVGGSTMLTGQVRTFFTFLGHPANALFIGMLVAFGLLGKWQRKLMQRWTEKGIADAGMILLITGVGGAFGALIKATPIAEYVGGFISPEMSQTPVFGLFAVFLVAAALKTAQGSSTAAIIITSTLVAPLLEPLGLSAFLGSVPIGAVLTVLAIGAGAMVVSHVNDSYFWVVTQFTGLSTRNGYRTLTMATLLQGLCSFAVVAILGLILL